MAAPNNVQIVSNVATAANSAPIDEKNCKIVHRAVLKKRYVFGFSSLQMLAEVF